MREISLLFSRLTFFLFALPSNMNLPLCVVANKVNNFTYIFNQQSMDKAKRGPLVRVQTMLTNVKNLTCQEAQDSHR